MLTEVGFLAAARADVKRAEAIFGALALLRPERSFAYIGLAMAYLNSDRPEEAVALLARGTQAVRAQDQGELQSVRALALQLAGRSAESLRALRAAGHNPLAQAMQGHNITDLEEH
ncbi:MAG: hypothetical protein K9J76_11120 [Polaromonas sp.]|nr:hypothetical protein [Polaromonas sp.]